MAPVLCRRAVSMSAASSTPYPTGMGSVSSSERLAAHSPASG